MPFTRAIASSIVLDEITFSLTMEIKSSKKPRFFFTSFVVLAVRALILPNLLSISCTRYNGALNLIPAGAVVINAMDRNTLGNTQDYDRTGELENFPEMLQDRRLESKFFPVLFDPDLELGELLASIPKVDYKKLYVEG